MSRSDERGNKQQQTNQEIRLGMGHYTPVTQAIRRVSRGLGRKLEKMKRQLTAESKQRPNLL